MLAVSVLASVLAASVLAVSVLASVLACASVVSLELVCPSLSSAPSQLANKVAKSARACEVLFIFIYLSFLSPVYQKLNAVSKFLILESVLNNTTNKLCLILLNLTNSLLDIRSNPSTCCWIKNTDIMILSVNITNNRSLSAYNQ